MIKIAVVLLLVSIIATSAFSIENYSPAYAQSGIDAGVFQPPSTGDEAMTSTNLPPELCPSQSSDEYWMGCSIGITIGSGFGTIEGGNARDSGLEPDPTFNYQPPTQEFTCQLYEDASGNVCDTNQQQVSDFFQGFDVGYVYGYSYGFSSSYVLDEFFPSQAPPEQQQQQLEQRQRQSPLQPGELQSQSQSGVQQMQAQSPLQPGERQSPLQPGEKQSQSQSGLQPIPFQSGQQPPRLPPSPN
jgi:hypothetical protein